MKVVAISDTHNKHNEITHKLHALSDQGYEMIIFGGDESMSGSTTETLNFLHWFNYLPFKYKIWIAGNHSLGMENNPNLVKRAMEDYPQVIYLNDSGVTIEGISIWGSPIQPWFCDWAFNRQRGVDIQKHWDLIPPDTDILITHGPPYGYGDNLEDGNRVGCKDLLATIEYNPPKYHIFGHIHNGYGEYSNFHTKFLNVAICNEAYKVANDPIIFEINK